MKQWKTEQRCYIFVQSQRKCKVLAAFAYRVCKRCHPYVNVCVGMDNVFGSLVRYLHRTSVHNLCGTDNMSYVPRSSRNMLPYKCRLEEEPPVDCSWIWAFMISWISAKKTIQYLKKFRRDYEHAVFDFDIHATQAELDPITEMFKKFCHRIKFDK